MSAVAFFHLRFLGGDSFEILAGLPGGRRAGLLHLGPDAVRPGPRPGTGPGLPLPHPFRAGLPGRLERAGGCVPLAAAAGAAGRCLRGQHRADDHFALEPHSVVRLGAGGGQPDLLPAHRHRRTEYLHRGLGGRSAPVRLRIHSSGAEGRHHLLPGPRQHPGRPGGPGGEQRFLPGFRHPGRPGWGRLPAPDLRRLLCRLRRLHRAGEKAGLGGDVHLHGHHRRDHAPDRGGGGESHGAGGEHSLYHVP